MELLEFGASFAVLKPSGVKVPPERGAGQAVLSRLPTLLFKICCFFLDWDMEDCWILGMIQQAVAIYSHSAVLPFHVWRLALPDSCFCSAV